MLQFLLMKDQVVFTDFAKLDLRVGEVVEARELELSRNLLELVVNFGPEIGKRTIYAGIKKWYEPESLVGRKLVFVVNLEPKKLKIGDQEYLSEGMLLAVCSEDSGEAVLYSFDKDLPSGTMIR